MQSIFGIDCPPSSLHFVPTYIGKQKKTYVENCSVLDEDKKVFAIILIFIF
jgi:hypothetical protein